MEEQDEFVMNILSRQGHDDVCKAFEAISQAVLPSKSCNGPRLIKDEDGNLYFSMMFFGIKTSEDWMDEVIWKDNVEEMVVGNDIVGAARRLVGKILKKFPEIKTIVRMKLEIKGYDVGRILSDD